MSNKHFSLLVKTLELEEQLSNSKFENYSLDNIEKDNKNKIWTFTNITYSEITREFLR